MTDIYYLLERYYLDGDSYLESDIRQNYQTIPITKKRELRYAIYKEFKTFTKLCRASIATSILAALFYVALEVTKFWLTSDNSYSSLIALIDNNWWINILKFILVYLFLSSIISFFRSRKVRRNIIKLKEIISS